METSNGIKSHLVLTSCWSLSGYLIEGAEEAKEETQNGVSAVVDLVHWMGRGWPEMRGVIHMSKNQGFALLTIVSPAPKPIWDTITDEWLEVND